MFITYTIKILYLKLEKKVYTLVIHLSATSSISSSTESTGL